MVMLAGNQCGQKTSVILLLKYLSGPVIMGNGSNEHMPASQAAVRHILDILRRHIKDERIVRAIIDDLEHAVVQAALVRISDVHVGAFADALEPFELLDF